MKKIFILFLLCVSACTPALHRVEQSGVATFKNPIFSTPMRAMKPDGAIIQLSPTALIDLTNQTIDSCELIAETPAGLFMNCVQNDVMTDYQNYPYFAEFVSTGLDDTGTYCLVQETVFKTKTPSPDSFVGRARFFIPKDSLKTPWDTKMPCGPTGTPSQIQPPERF